jgi:hypothetical protein
MCGNCARHRGRHQPAQTHRHRTHPYSAPRAQDGIRQDRESVDLQQHRAVAQPCRVQSGIGPALGMRRKRRGRHGAFPFLAISFEIFGRRFPRVARRSGPLSHLALYRSIHHQPKRSSFHGSPCMWYPFRLPKSSLVAIQQLQARDPLRALPGVQLRHDQPRRPAMLFGRAVGPSCRNATSASSARKSASGRLVLNPAS